MCKSALRYYFAQFVALHGVRVRARILRLLQFLACTGTEHQTPPELPGQTKGVSSGSGDHFVGGFEILILDGDANVLVFCIWPLD